MSLQMSFQFPFEFTFNVLPISLNVSFCAVESASMDRRVILSWVEGISHARVTTDFAQKNRLRESGYEPNTSLGGLPFLSWRHGWWQSVLERGAPRSSGGPGKKRRKDSRSPLPKDNRASALACGAPPVSTTAPASSQKGMGPCDPGSTQPGTHLPDPKAVLVLPMLAPALLHCSTFHVTFARCFHRS